MTTRTRRSVEKLALDLLAAHGIDEAPVDVDWLAEQLGFQVVYKFFDDVDLSGTVMKDADRLITIGINTLHAHVRQRFSIAHEIGHAKLHFSSKGEDLIVDPPARSVYNRDPRASLAEDVREIEANQFAASLLMPEDIVRKVGSGMLKNRKSLKVEALIEALADKFDVSTQAMRFRLVNLGVLEPG